MRRLPNEQAHDEKIMDKVNVHHNDYVSQETNPTHVAVITADTLMEEEELQLPGAQG